MGEEERASTATQILRAEGKRVTPQRTLLLRIIQQNSGHLDADEIYRQARENYPRISLSTVYRTVSLLRELGLVEELHFDEEHHHYEMVTDTVHHHLVCTGCGQIVEFESPVLDELWAGLEREHGFALERVHIDALGRCQECQRRSERNAPGSRSRV